MLSATRGLRPSESDPRPVALGPAEGCSLPQTPRHIVSQQFQEIAATAMNELPSVTV